MSRFGGKFQGGVEKNNTKNMKYAEILKNVAAVLSNTDYQLSDKQKQMIEDLGVTTLHKNLTNTHNQDDVER